MKVSELQSRLPALRGFQRGPPPPPRPPPSPVPLPIPGCFSTAFRVASTQPDITDHRSTEATAGVTSVTNFLGSQKREGRKAREAAPCPSHYPPPLVVPQQRAAGLLASSLPLPLRPAQLEERGGSPPPSRRPWLGAGLVVGFVRPFCPGARPSAAPGVRALDFIH